MERNVFLSLTLALALVITACSSGNAGESEMEMGDEGDGLQVTMVQANLTLPTPTGAIYMRIINGTDQDEKLTGATVPGCGTIELHEMTMVDDVMTMREVEGGEILIPAGETVELKQGGLHVMCIDKTGEYTVGETITITLDFANAGPMEVSAEIIPPGEMQMDMPEGEMK